MKSLEWDKETEDRKKFQNKDAKECCHKVVNILDEFNNNSVLETH